MMQTACECCFLLLPLCQGPRGVRPPPPRLQCFLNCEHAEQGQEDPAAHCSAQWYHPSCAWAHSPRSRLQPGGQWRFDCCSVKWSMLSIVLNFPCVLHVLVVCVWECVYLHSLLLPLLPVLSSSPLPLLPRLYSSPSPSFPSTPLSSSLLLLSSSSSLGYTPALCCAPNPQVAECLFSILQAVHHQES